MKQYRCTEDSGWEKFQISTLKPVNLHRLKLYVSARALKPPKYLRKDTNKMRANFFFSFVSSSWCLNSLKQLRLWNLHTPCVYAYCAFENGKKKFSNKEEKKNAMNCLLRYLSSKMNPDAFKLTFNKNSKFFFLRFLLFLSLSLKRMNIFFFFSK